VAFLTTVPTIPFHYNGVQGKSTVLDFDPSVGNAKMIIHVTRFVQNSLKSLKRGRIDRNIRKDKLKTIKFSIAQEVVKHTLEFSIATNTHASQNIDDMVMRK